MGDDYKAVTWPRPSGWTVTHVIVGDAEVAITPDGGELRGTGVYELPEPITFQSGE